jgi:coenzyme F420-0:L-glutamate ligase/coenzyme F420-1:gamma-L-glutamate ligase
MANPVPSLPVPPTIAIRILDTLRPSGAIGKQMIACSQKLEVIAIPGIPLIGPGDDLASLIAEALSRADFHLRNADVLVVTSKVVSRAEGRFVDLTRIEPSDRAMALAREVGKDARMVELILRESTYLSRKTPGALIVRHRLGFISANAGIDASNAQPVQFASGSGPWALLLPEAPDRSAADIRQALESSSGVSVGVVISDSFGRPFRLGTVGAAIGCAGLPPLWDRRGERDLYGRVLENTITGLADQVAACADLVAGQADEGRAVVLVRGLRFSPSELPAQSLYRAADEDVYA